MTRVNDACKIPYRTVYLCFHLALNKQDRDTGTRYYLFLTFTIVIKTEQGMISVLFLNTMSDRRSIIDHGECRVFRSSRFSSNGSLSPRKINVSTNVVTYVRLRYSWWLRIFFPLFSFWLNWGLFLIGHVTRVVYNCCISGFRFFFM